MESLNKYKQKRNFDKTEEPIGKKQKRLKKLRFVVQHHIASHNHYDLRLEWNGVLKSFAIPKCPSYNSKIKRLAIEVEDHPLEYRIFEGTIPKGEYGGGTVMIFDEGYWEPVNKKVSFKKKINFVLKGQRFKGSWTLVHLEKNNWLFIKEKDGEKGIDLRKFKTSVKSGKTMDDIAAKVVLTNPGKLIDVKNKITKKDIFTYYEKVSMRMLPLVCKRFVSVVRSPQGLNGQSFFMKHFTNEFLGKKKAFYYLKDKWGLLEEVQMNSFEFHIGANSITNLHEPNYMVFDLDPDEGLSLEKLREGVLDLKQILDALALPSFLKTSGKKGYHVVVPITQMKWLEFRLFAKRIAEVMEKKWPDKYTSKMSKQKRRGKIFIDWVRNTLGASSVAPYSVRLKENLPVSMPIKWSELYKIKPDDITMKEALRRLKNKDPWADFYDFY